MHYVFIGITLICFGILIATSPERHARKRRRRTPTKQHTRRQHGNEQPLAHELLPYTVQQLITPAERAFFDVLQEVAPRGWQIFAQVRLANLIRVSPDAPDWQVHWNRIQAKCVDFVLCEPVLLTPQLVIELDDASHQHTSRQARDAFVDEALRAAGLPIVHLPWQHSYSQTLVAAQIAAALHDSPYHTTIKQTMSNTSPDH